MEKDTLVRIYPEEKINSVMVNREKLTFFDVFFSKCVEKSRFLEFSTRTSYGTPLFSILNERGEKKTSFRKIKQKIMGGGGLGIQH